MDSPDLVCTTVVALSGKITRAKAQLPGNILKEKSFLSVKLILKSIL